MIRQIKRGVIGLLVFTSLLCTEGYLDAQGSAFTYQGRLQSGTNLANGSYDFTFSVWSKPTGPSQIGDTFTNAATSVTDGLFTATVDFGGNVFDGSPRWLEIGVRTNGGNAFSTLSPRQALTAAPYAIYAGGVNASGINGAITSNMLAPGAAAANLAANGQSSVPNGGIVLSSSPNATNLFAVGYARFGGPLELSWQNVAGSQALAARASHTAVWTGSKMIVWGGVDYNGLNTKNTGDIYDPSASVWQQVTTNSAPFPRYGHTAVWTGTEMIIWGGYGNGYSNDGGRYNPTTGDWLPMTTNNAPAPRRYHSAVWTGSEIIIWGGDGSNDTALNSGARYNPYTDTWLPMNTSNAPAPRFLHTAVWTGNEMVVWGGLSNATEFLRDGARYNPLSDTWSPVSTNGAPAARAYHVAVWTGSEMIIWGGQGGTIYGDGYRYTPSTDSWLPVATLAAPTPRYGLSAVWTGSEMIVWGGANGGFLNDGARYNAANDAWFAVTTTDAPAAREGNSAVWTGTEMLIFGGYNNATTFNDCYSYAPSRVMYLYQRE